METRESKLAAKANIVLKKVRCKARATETMYFSFANLSSTPVMVIVDCDEHTAPKSIQLGLRAYRKLTDRKKRREAQAKGRAAFYAWSDKNVERAAKLLRANSIRYRSYTDCGKRKLRLLG